MRKRIFMLYAVGASCTLVAATHAAGIPPMPPASSFSWYVETCGFRFAPVAATSMKASKTRRQHATK